MNPASFPASMLFELGYNLGVLELYASTLAILFIRDSVIAILFSESLKYNVLLQLGYPLMILKQLELSIFSFLYQGR